MLIFFFVALSACSVAQDADKIHAMASKNPFPISAAEYNEITDFRVAYFTEYHYISNWVFHNALEVKGVLASGKYFVTNLEIGLSDDNTYFFTGNSESCVSLRSPKAAFTVYGCAKGADYFATLTDKDK